MEKILDIMRQAPSVLRDLIEEIPSELLKVQRIPNKWAIHEHACHLAEAQDMMIQRFKVFKSEKNPVFKPYLPGTNVDASKLMDMNLHKVLGDFETKRKEMIELLVTFGKDDWNNEGQHDEYTQFNAKIFARHIMMHDHFHMYRIEELWLTKDAYLPI